MKLPSRRQLPLILIALADGLLAIYLLRLGLRGMLDADGTGEGLLAMIVAAFGIATVMAAIPAWRWSRRASTFSPRGYAIRLIIAAVVGGFPWVVVAAFALG